MFLRPILYSCLFLLFSALQAVTNLVSSLAKKLILNSPIQAKSEFIWYPLKFVNRKAEFCAESGLARRNQVFYLFYAICFTGLKSEWSHISQLTAFSFSENTNHPVRERPPTPPPLQPPLPKSFDSHAQRLKTTFPQFLHSSELPHHHFSRHQCNNSSLPDRHIDSSARELCEAVSRAEVWTQRSMQGLRRHARKLLAATEAEERRLRARLLSLQNEMAVMDETDQNDNSTPREQVKDPRNQGRVGRWTI